MTNNPHENTPAARAFVPCLGQHVLASCIRLAVGVRCFWPSPPSARRTIYFANHSSHLDALVIWACLPDAARCRTRPVAAADYWRRPGPRGFFAGRVFNAVFVERGFCDPKQPENALAPLHAALDAGESLILFPEGTRNTSDEGGLLPFKGGLHRLSRAHPDAVLVPVWLENLNRMLPKGRGAWLPVPLLCRLVMGPALEPARPDERSRDFLNRAAAALSALRPAYSR